MLFAGAASALYVPKWTHKAIVGDPHLLTRRFRDVRDALVAPDRLAPLRASVVAQMLLIALSELTDEPALAPDSRRTLDSFAADARMRMSLGDRARKLGMTVDELRRLIHLTTGRSPTSHVRELRIQEAQRLLVETEWSISRVSDAVGFDDPAYFSRVFRKLTGRAPSTFRRDEQRVVASDGPREARR